MDNIRLLTGEEHSSRGGKIGKYIAAAAAAGVCAFAAVFTFAANEVPESAEITAADSVAYETEATDVFVSRDGDYIGGDEAALLKITVRADGEDTVMAAVPGSTVRDVLTEAGISFDGNDILSVEPMSKVINGSTVTLSRVEYVRQSVTRSFKLDTEYREDDTLPEGTQEVITEGEKGEIVVDVLSKVVDGETEDVEVLGKEITQPAVRRVVLQGTMKREKVNYTANSKESEEISSAYEETDAPAVEEESTPADTLDEAVENAVEAASEEVVSEDVQIETEAVVTVTDEENIPAEQTQLAEDEDGISEFAEEITAGGVDPNSVERVSRFDIPEWLELDENGVPTSYTTTHTGKSCAYTAEPDALMSTGKTVFQGYVAVDPDIIPYGSELYIIADDGSVYGYAIAADTGYSARAGHIIVDLFMSEYDDCIRWGAKQVTIYVLK